MIGTSDLDHACNSSNYADEVAKQMAGVQPMSEDAWETLMAACDGYKEGEVLMLCATGSGGKTPRLCGRVRDNEP